MSNIIVMPGSKEFDETLAGTKTSAKKPAKKTPSALEPVDLVGRTLMLNSAKIQTFQCGGFHLGTRHPFAIVSEQAQQGPIRAALADERLIDVTGQDLTKGYKGQGGQTSEIQSVDTGKKVFIATDGRGNLYIATPKSKAEAKRFDREIKATGTLRLDYTQEMTGFTGITEEVIESSDNPPVKPAKKPGKAKNVRSRSRKRSA